MNLFSVKNISKIRGDKKLFSDTTFGLQPAEKWGFIAVMDPENLLY